MHEQEVVGLTFRRCHAVVFAAGDGEQQAFPCGHAAALGEPAVGHAAQGDQAAAFFEHVEFVRQLAVAQGVEHMVDVGEHVDVVLFLVVDEPFGAKLAHPLFVAAAAVGDNVQSEAFGHGDRHGAEAAGAAGDEHGFPGLDVHDIEGLHSGERRERNRGGLLV